VRTCHEVIPIPRAGLQHPWVDGQDPGAGVADDRQLRVEHQRRDHRRIADLEAEGDEQRCQDAEEGEAGDCQQCAGDAQHRFSEALPPRGEDTQRQSAGGGDAHRDPNHLEVIHSLGHEAVEVVEDVMDQVHHFSRACPGADLTLSIPSTSCTLS